MMTLKKFACAAAIALATNAAQAEAVMNDWTFNPIGTGQAKGQEINEYLDVNGNGFIQLKSNGNGSFSFTEHAVFNLVQADSNGHLFPLDFKGGNISATLTAVGTGNFGGSFAFTTGTVKMYQNPVNKYGSTLGYYGADLGNLIATFSVLGGGGMVDGKGSPVSNGQISIFLESKVGDLKEGYFFNNRGVDMSTLDNTAFAFTNANPLGKPTKRLVSEVACEFAGYKGAGCGKGGYTNVPGDHFFVSSNGQFKFADVPEPGSAALFGIALFGLGALRRRVK